MPASALLHRLTSRNAPRGQRAGGRLDAIDAARGAALLAMAVYHTLWDLGFLQVTPMNYALTPTGRTAARLIAGSFLILVGIGLVLMNRDSLRWRPFAWRLVRIGGAALLITIATAVAFPQSFIFFGILHCIAVSSVLALPFLLLPPLASALAAGAVFAASAFLRHPWLDANALFFLGLGRGLPDTNDWVPLFPWFGVVLAGVALARFGLPAFAASRLGRWQAQGGIGRVATAAGRHSLAIYLIHQPLLFGLVYLSASLTGPHPQAGVAEFRSEFEATCARNGGAPEPCRSAAICVSDALRREGLWNLGRSATPEERTRAQSLAQGCYEAAEDAPLGKAPPE